jgi:hypothetical protein
MKTKDIVIGADYYVGTPTRTYYSANVKPATIIATGLAPRRRRQDSPATVAFADPAGGPDLDVPFGAFETYKSSASVLVRTDNSYRLVPAQNVVMPWAEYVAARTAHAKRVATSNQQRNDRRDRVIAAACAAFDVTVPATAEEIDYYNRPAGQPGCLSQSSLFYAYDSTLTEIEALLWAYNYATAKAQA